jgi:5,10-methylene-tetrahydrofolate dehydrogenase/methenyl tetrahydrofolate cyclohydrolase
VYVRNKEKACKKAGINSVAHRLPADTPEADLRALVAALNADPEVDGILVQLPLPKHLPERAILDLIVPEKDVDGFHPVNQGRVLLGDRAALAPCTPAGVLELLRRNGLAVAGKRAVVVVVGIHRLDDGSLAGDLDFAPCAERASAITPVPGGIGPMTIALLLTNTVRAGLARRGWTE